jgi:hypothetical protein
MTAVGPPRRSPLGWIAVPALLGVLVVIGLAISTESRDNFENRTSANDTNEQAGQQPNNGNDQPSPDFEPDAGGDLSEDEPGATGESQEQGDSTQGTPEQDTAESGDGEPGDGESQQQLGDGEATTPVVIQTPNGDVVVQLGNGDTVTALSGDSPIPTDPARTLTPSSDGDLGGVRVTEDGNLEPIDVPEQADRDFGLSPAPGGGLEVTRPDGSTVTLDPAGDGSVTATESVDGRTENVPADSDVVIQPADRFPEGQQTDPTGQPLIVETPNGPVRLELTGDGDLVANQPDPDSVVQIDPDDLVAIRVDENGNLEVVPLDEIGPDDTVLVPTDGGVDLVRPDGSRVEFRLDGENDGVTATEVTVDGDQIELTPNPDGSITLEDGTTVGPIDFAEDGSAIERLLDQTADLPWPWVFGAIALLTALSVATAVYLYKNQPNNEFDFGQLAATGVDVDEFEHFLAVLSSDPDPARAIRLAFYAAERGLGGLPPRRPDETPFEWHNRVEQIRPELAEPLGPICDRFAMVRFAPGHATSEDRDAVVARLRQLNLMAAGAAGPPHQAMAGV